MKHYVILTPKGSLFRTPAAEDNLKFLQSIVGGNIEGVYLNLPAKTVNMRIPGAVAKPVAVMFLNSDGKALGLPVNEPATQLLSIAGGIPGDRVVGVVVLEAPGEPCGPLMSQEEVLRLLEEAQSGETTITE